MSTVLLRASLALQRSFYPALRRLCVDGDEGRLIISGQVTSYYLKQLAQETIMPVRGPLRLVNQVDVVSGPRR